MVLLSTILLLAAGGIGFGLGRATGPDRMKTAAASTTTTTTSTSKPPSSFTITGTMTAAGCGSGGYSDIRAGAQVEITNQQNDVLGVGTLRASAVGGCSFSFSVSGIQPGERLYGVHIGNSNRGVIWKTEQEARTEGFHLTLGS